MQHEIFDPILCFRKREKYSNKSSQFEVKDRFSDQLEYWEEERKRQEDSKEPKDIIDKEPKEAKNKI